MNIIYSCVIFLLAKKLQEQLNARRAVLEENLLESKECNMLHSLDFEEECYEPVTSLFEVMDGAIAGDIRGPAGEDNLTFYQLKDADSSQPVTFDLDYSKFAEGNFKENVKLLNN